jgi:flagellar FliL protein
MSDEEAAVIPVVATSTAAGGISVVQMMMTVVLAVVVAMASAGGAAYWLVKSGRLPLGGVKTVEVAVKLEPVKTKLVALDPMLVNLADPDGRSYLRLSLTLKVEDPPPAKDAKPKEEAAAKGAPKNEFEAEERDTALDVLGRETGAELLAPDGKEHVKRDLSLAFAQHVPEVKVVEVLITEFLVQR